MVEKLHTHFDRLRSRFSELEQTLSDGSIFSNPQKAQELTREHSRLKNALQSYDQLGQIDETRRKNREILDNPDGQDPEFVELLTAEQAELDSKREALELEVQFAVLPPDPHEDRNIVVEIRAGTGGDEAALFAADLYRMYSRFIEKIAGWKQEVLDANPSDLGGYREIIFQVSGENVFRDLKFESGVHRVQRVPATEAQGRIHTSTATVAVMPEAKEVDIDIKPEELRIEVCRASGPGGQGVNTTDSAVQVMHLPTGMIVRCQDGRSQIKNKERAISILRTRLLDLKRAEEAEKLAAQRRSQVGTGDRNEKIRTYNYPQNRITDHRINKTIYDLPGFMEGNISDMLESLARHDLDERLASLSA